MSKQKQIASPYSTGGGGPNYEAYVTAYYLASVLIGSVPRGQEAGITREVRLQRLYEGEDLDDLIIISDLTTGEAKLALQMKRDLAFGEKDSTFDEVIGACWNTFKSSEFNLGRDRFGIVIGLYSKTIDEYYQSVLTWARNSANSTDFLTRIFKPKLTNQTQRSFVELIREKLNICQGSDISDDDLWNFLRSMVILHFDFQKEGSRDYNYSIQTVSYLLPSEQKNEAPNLFTKLVEYAAEANITAGSFNSEILTQKLLSDNFALLPFHDSRADLNRLQEPIDFILRDIRSDVGGFVLDRGEIVNTAREMMKKTSLLLLVGSPGTGKSAILKTLVEYHRHEGFTIVLAWDRISGNDWNSFATSLQITQPLKKLILAVSGTSHPAIFIDGIDKIIDSGKCKVINDLIRILAEIPLSQDGSRRWTVVASVREENLEQLYTNLDWRILGKPEKLPIPELSSKELDSIAEHSPRLKPLLLLQHLRPIISKLFILSLLEDQRMIPDVKSLPPIATEVEVSQVWWENLVGKNSVEGRTRQQSLLKLGKQVIKSPGRRLLSEDISSEALISLESDRILLRDPNADVHRFSHDLLEDWVLCRVLNQNREDLASYLQELGQPFGLFRTVQLLGAFLLERYETANEWIQLTEQVEQATNLSSRWYQAILTAPLISPRAPELLNKTEYFLFADDAKRLIKLLIALRTVEVNPNLELLPYLEDPNQPIEQVMSDLLSDPVPKWQIWLPFMRWFVPKLSNLPITVRTEAAKLMEIWQLKTPVNSIFRKEIGEIALFWLQEAEKDE